MSDRETGERRRRGKISVPVGLEQLLYTAASDPEIRAELIRDRAAAAERRGLDLTASERSVLGIAPDDQLEAMIDRIDTSEQNLKKRKFMRAVAATAVTLAAGTGLAAGGCTDRKPGPETDAPFQGAAEKVDVEVDIQQTAPGGARPVETIPDVKLDAGKPEAEVLNPELMTSGGARPKVDVDDPEMNLDGGARPDIAEDLPTPSKPETKVKQPKLQIGGITVGGPGDIDLE